ncbi:MAG: TIGR01244 family sulfur transferase [Salibaculum sp.]|jgi:uncharacterized protein (TIGR01244 family)|uniref:TIGR01244 family sulfur transferase n=1 Tax=Roseovarius halophilus (ex Wu et al. 2025) TaxID=3376060 RepID=UPI00287006FC|nr:TIGR01244 family sulfur transferase [Salibaculum sp.]MDR9428595.1 TIGR01244 family sulfur transferase [Salibaculum sp.]MDR9482987.1 TIGR01244 family sulfur transferase [Salibaculum sp.]
MDIRPLSPDHAVSPQIDPADLPAIAAAGYRLVICNRPDAENPPDHHAAVMEEAARAAGLDFVNHPVTHPAIGPETIDRQMQAIDTAPGPVLAYCASGTRCSVLWALGRAGTLGVDAVLEATGRAGYDLAPLRPQLEAFAGR